MPTQGLELFRALHERGIAVEFVHYPTQGHVFFDEDVFRDWVTRNLQWFDYWLLGKGPNPLRRKAPVGVGEDSLPRGFRAFSRPARRD